MFRLTTWMAPIVMVLAGSMAHAQQDNPILVELFTSQGCAACPPADAVLSELSARDDVIPLALHVDYWDYIGWKDEFADPAFTKRQKGYARAAGRRSLYTPQMIVAGRYDVVGSRPMKVVDAIRAAAEHASPVKLLLARDGGDLVIRAEPLSKMPPETVVHLVRYAPEKIVDIEDGENAGLEMTYTNIAHGWQVIGSWDGQGAFETSVPLEGDDPAVVLLQEPPFGPVLAAARWRD
ncbi:DUF1223 domain-containing protein [Alloyangia pacifica]|uniref:DUF1223 domain-containing protein n=1 Tax=Alloyangia pacifica TaxID=311180 RepID=A0A1I6PBX0_9RHOB|nr:DUF1223 domain-containing protein [Alloyangia pacifica]SDG24065.1 hypothetical protein SAMN04488245_102131 [Alloyangia pacifica]SFS37625.1 hypothetical protein SAMN04488050_101432 [Alloyangia pacifica]